MPLVTHVLSQLRGHRSLQQLLGQLLQKPVLANQILGLLVVFQQVVNQLIVDTFVFGHLFSLPTLSQLAVDDHLHKTFYTLEGFTPQTLNSSRS